MLSLENPSIKNGIIAGLITSGIVLVFYLINARMVFSVAGWVSTIVFIYFMVQSVKADKAELEFTSFGDALKPAFLTYVVGNLLYIIFYFVLLNYIAPDLLDIQKEIAMETIEKIGGLMGEDALEEALDEVDARTSEFGLSTALWSYAWGLIFPGFIIAAIIALIMKDRKPAEV